MVDHNPKFCNQCGTALKSIKRHPYKICIKCMVMYSSNGVMPVSLISELRKQINELQMQAQLIKFDCDHEFMDTNETSFRYYDTGYGERKVTTFKYVCPFCESIEWRDK